MWDKIAGLYACAADGGGMRLHTNFAHHRDGALRVLGLPPGTQTPRDAVAVALSAWTAEAFEEAAAKAGLVAAALRSVDAWDRHPQCAAIATLPLVELSRLGDAPPLP